MAFNNNRKSRREHMTKMEFYMNDELRMKLSAITHFQNGAVHRGRDKRASSDD